MTVDDWMLLLKHLHFFDEAYQQREGTLCFVNSRLRAIDEESERGKKRMRHLSFEDFLEALVRASPAISYHLPPSPTISRHLSPSLTFSHLLSGACIDDEGPADDR